MVPVTSPRAFKAALDSFRLCCGNAAYPMLIQLLGEQFAFVPLQHLVNGRHCFKQLHDDFQFLFGRTTLAILSTPFAKPLQDIWMLDKIFSQFQRRISKRVALPNHSWCQLQQALDRMHIPRPASCMQR